MVRPERLLGAARLVLRFATDRRRAPRGSVQLGRGRPSVELPASWFVARFLRVTKTFARQALTGRESCYLTSGFI